jgi:hypothetical protein
MLDIEEAARLLAQRFLDEEVSHEAMTFALVEGAGLMQVPEACGWSGRSGWGG